MKLALFTCYGVSFEISGPVTQGRNVDVLLVEMPREKIAAVSRQEAEKAYAERHSQNFENARIYSIGEGLIEVMVPKQAHFVADPA